MEKKIKKLLILKANSGVDMKEYKIKGYTFLNDASYILEPFCLSSARLRVAICHNCTVTSLSTMSEPWSEHPYAMLNANEAA